MHLATLEVLYADGIYVEDARREPCTPEAACDTSRQRGVVKIPPTWSSGRPHPPAARALPGRDPKDDVMVGATGWASPTSARRPS